METKLNFPCSEISSDYELKRKNNNSPIIPILLCHSSGLTSCSSFSSSFQLQDET